MSQSLSHCRTLLSPREIVYQQNFIIFLSFTNVNKSPFYLFIKMWKCGRHTHKQRQKIISKFILDQIYSKCTCVIQKPRVIMTVIINELWKIVQVILLETLSRNVLHHVPRMCVNSTFGKRNRPKLFSLNCPFNSTGRMYWLPANTHTYKNSLSAPKVPLD